MTLKGFDLIFQPRSVAVIGASTTAGTVGKAVMDNLIWGGFPGKIYPVNIKPVQFPNLKSYPSIAAIDDPVDLAVVMVPAAAVPEVFTQIAKHGTKAAIVISAGFSESGLAGEKLENQVVEICRHHDITLVGPNCLGVINPAFKLNATFAKSLANAGGVAFVSQSGALGVAVLDLAASLGIGFSKFISIGNKAALAELDLLEYLATDETTKVIGMYMEDLTPHPHWVESVRQITHHPHSPKPIVVLKAGRSLKGGEAARSHTGALAGNDQAYDAFFRQSGITRVEGLSELFATLAIMADCPVPKKSGVAIITNAGGPGIIAADAAEAKKVTLAELTKRSEAQLEKQLPKTAAIENPIDVVGDAHADRYAATLEVIGRDPNVGSGVVILTPQATTDVIQCAEVIVKAKQKFAHLALVASFFGGEAVRSGAEALRRAHVPTVTYPDDAIAAMSHLSQYAQFLSRTKVVHLPHQTPREKINRSLLASYFGSDFVAWEGVEEILAAFRMPLVKSVVAKSAAEAVTLAHNINKAVAMKVVSPEIIHKAASGGVRLHVLPDQVASVYEEMEKTVKAKNPGKKIVGIMVQPMAEAGEEIILGARRDPVFGPLVMVGAGGGDVEFVRDVTFGIAPCSEVEAMEMLDQLRLAAFFHDSEGKWNAKAKTVAGLVSRLSDMMISYPKIIEVDINPVVVDDQGSAQVLDCRIIVDREEKQPK